MVKEKLNHQRKYFDKLIKMFHIYIFFNELINRLLKVKQITNYCYLMCISTLAKTNRQSEI